MNVETFFAPAAHLRYTTPLRQLQQNLQELIAHESTRAAFVTLSEGVCMSSRYAHVDLYEAIAAEHDMYNPDLPKSFGFIHARPRTTLVWYLTFFTVGRWEYLSAIRATTTPHVCLLQTYTLAEIAPERRRH